MRAVPPTVIRADRLSKRYHIGRDVSRYGRLAGSDDATMKDDHVAHVLRKTADAQPCPGTLPPGYDAFVGVDDGKAQSCEGGKNHNSWYGDGQVNALAAVTQGK